MNNLNYLYEPDIREAFLSRNLFVDKKLGFQIIKHGTIVPCTSRVVDGISRKFGGIFDSEGKYIKSSSRRYGDGGVYTPPPKHIDKFSSETVIYLGKLNPTWGHFITDHIRFLWFLRSDVYKNEFKNCPLVYITFHNFNFETLPNHRRIFELLGVNFDNLREITQPTQFENVVLPDESYRFSEEKGTSHFFTNGYVETIDFLRDFALKNRTPTPNKKVYYFYGKFQTGEERLAAYFKSKGYEIVSPEKFTLDQQLNILINCESFASTLGSLSHNSIFLRDETETIFIPRVTGGFTGCQRILNQFHNLNINFIDSNLSVFSKGIPRANCFIISRYLKEFFGDKFEGYEEDDFRIFLQYVKKCIGENLVIDSKTKDRYVTVLPEFMEQLKQHEDLIAACEMPAHWDDELQIPPSLLYQTHVSSQGWSPWIDENQISNPLDQKRDIQAIKIHLPKHKIYYSVYYNDEEGWSDEVTSPRMAGIVGKSKSIYGMRIRLAEPDTKKSDIIYRMHKFDGTWTPWAKNGEVIYSYGVKCNAIQIETRWSVMMIDEMRRELQQRLNKERFAHSIGVANTAVKLAKRFGVDETKAYVAGLLHDCAREFENDELPAQAEARGIKIGEVERATPLLLHPYIGAQMIKEIYGVDDAEISQAIYRHTVGAPDMTPLDKIIYFADMIEPNRNYPGVEKLRALAETADLDEILLTAFGESIIFVVQKNSLVHPDTVAARNFLLLNK